jgi:hypothetical protein
LKHVVAASTSRQRRILLLLGIQQGLNDLARALFRLLRPAAGSVQFGDETSPAARGNVWQLRVRAAGHAVFRR